MDNGAASMFQLLNQGALNKEPFSPLGKEPVKSNNHLPFDPSHFLSLIKEKQPGSFSKEKSPQDNFTGFLKSALEGKQAPNPLSALGGVEGLKTFTEFNDVMGNMKGPTRAKKAHWQQQYSELKDSLYAAPEKTPPNQQKATVVKNPFRQKVLVGVEQKGNAFGAVNGKDFPDDWDEHFTEEDTFFNDLDTFQNNLQMSGGSSDDSDFTPPDITFEKSDTSFSDMNLPTNQSSNELQDNQTGDPPSKKATPESVVGKLTDEDFSDPTFKGLTQAFSAFLEGNNEIEKGQDPFENIDFGATVSMFQNLLGEGANLLSGLFGESPSDEKESTKHDIPATSDIPEQNLDFLGDIVNQLLGGFSNSEAPKENTGSIKKEIPLTSSAETPNSPKPTIEQSKTEEGTDPVLSQFLSLLQGSSKENQSRQPQDKKATPTTTTPNRKTINNLDGEDLSSSNQTPSREDPKEIAQSELQEPSQGFQATPQAPFANINPTLLQTVFETAGQLSAQNTPNTTAQETPFDHIDPAIIESFVNQMNQNQSQIQNNSNTKDQGNKALSSLDNTNQTQPAPQFDISKLASLFTQTNAPPPVPAPAPATPPPQQTPSMESILQLLNGGNIQPQNNSVENMPQNTVQENTNTQANALFSQMLQQLQSSSSSTPAPAPPSGNSFENLDLSALGDMVKGNSQQTTQPQNKTFSNPQSGESFNQGTQKSNPQFDPTMLTNLLNQIQGTSPPPVPPANNTGNPDMSALLQLLQNQSANSNAQANIQNNAQTQPTFSQGTQQTQLDPNMLQQLLSQMQNSGSAASPGQNQTGSANSDNLMNMLGMFQAMNGQSGDNTQNNSPMGDTNLLGMMSLLGGLGNSGSQDNQNNPMGNMGTMMQMLGGFGGGSEQTEVSSLLEALRPFLSEPRREKLGSTMQMLNMFKMVPLFNGM